MSVGRIGLRSCHELDGDRVELVAGGAVTDLGLEVLMLGGQIEGVDIDLLLDIDVPLHCEMRCPPATLCLPLPALGFLRPKIINVFIIFASAPLSSTELRVGR